MTVRRTDRDPVRSPDFDPEVVYVWPESEHGIGATVRDAVLEADGKVGLYVGRRGSNRASGSSEEEVIRRIGQ